MNPDRSDSSGDNFIPRGHFRRGILVTQWKGVNANRAPKTEKNPEGFWSGSLGVTRHVSRSELKGSSQVLVFPRAMALTSWEPVWVNPSKETCVVICTNWQRNSLWYCWSKSVAELKSDALIRSRSQFFSLSGIDLVFYRVRLKFIWRCYLDKCGTSGLIPHPVFETRNL
jgi:hypothetical protein